MRSGSSRASAEPAAAPPVWTESRRSRAAAHLFTLAFLAAWWGYSLTVPPFVLPGPVPVATRLIQFFTTYDLYKQAFASFGHIAAGMAVSMIVGSALALAAHYLPVLRLAVHGRLSPFLNSFSGIGWTLLSIVWFGVNELTVVFAISVVLTPFAIINMREGLETLDRELLEMAASFTRNRWREFAKIVVPGLMPFVFATLRISFGVSWKVALAAELFGGRTGLGYLFNLAQQNFDMRLILVVIAVIIAFVYGTDRLVFAPLQARFGRPDPGNGAMKARRLAERVIADGVVVGAVVGWWLLSLRLPDFLMPGPWQVAKTLAGLFLTPSLLADTAASAARVVASVALAAVLGGALAVIPYRWPVADGIVRDRITPFLNSFPSVGWAILAMIWFGTTDAAVIFVEVAILTPFCLINILEGLKELDRELIEMGSSFTRHAGRTFVKIVVPMLLPYMLSAIRIAYGVAWKIALVAELFGVSSGLGYLMLKAEIVSDAATVYATCFAIVLLFLAGEKLVLDPLSRLVAYK